jgi:hypothetical protein
MKREGAMRVRVQEEERAIYRAIFPGDAVTSSENADLRTLRAYTQARSRSIDTFDRHTRSIVSTAMRVRFILRIRFIFPSLLSS